MWNIFTTVSTFVNEESLIVIRSYMREPCYIFIWMPRTCTQLRNVIVKPYKTYRAKVCVFCKTFLAARCITAFIAHHM